MTTRVATCACEQLRITCTGDPMFVSLCHCLDCQKRTGSAYGVAAFFPREKVESSGDLRSFQRTGDSGFAVTFHFCPNWGSTVFWEPARRADMVAVAVGAFADPAFPPQSRSVYEERRHAWIPGLN